MEQLANKGNGNNYYIDGIEQAKRVFRDQIAATLEVVAKDVKLQVEFDPERVRALSADRATRTATSGLRLPPGSRRCRRDRRGHQVTALYELEAERPRRRGPRSPRCGSATRHRPARRRPRRRTRCRRRRSRPRSRRPRPICGSRSRPRRSPMSCAQPRCDDLAAVDDPDARRRCRRDEPGAPRAGAADQARESSCAPAPDPDVGGQPAQRGNSARSMKSASALRARSGPTGGGPTCSARPYAHCIALP